MLLGSYIKVNVVLVVLFTILYHMTDLLMYYYSHEATQLDLGTIQHIDKIMDIFHFSLVTQTTVGYTSQFHNAMDTKSIPFKIINYIQLLSIFVVTCYFLEQR